MGTHAGFQKGLKLRKNSPDGSIPACAGNSRAPAARNRAHPVHPRVCGELGIATPTILAEYGSSPRVRGTPVQRGDKREVRRFIPACAGNSTSNDQTPTPRAVHPRVCGELINAAHADTLNGGSSPRVRGTPSPREPCPRASRFIPACAGNSPDPREWAFASPVHPRVCGELLRSSAVFARLSGSSPRVRGTRAVVGFRARRRRFIPACAGNSQLERTLARLGTVHPRVCGELGMTIAIAIVVAGSSPRVRGTPRRQKQLARVLRFIPACAGNSSAARRDRCSVAVHPRVCGELARGCQHRGCVASVHPRVCGELAVTLAAAAAAIGSSPRVRGTLRPSRTAYQNGRFIPACAGNSRPARRGTPAPPVHPRVCGELTSRSTETVVRTGSSPRVRGTPCLATWPCRGSRFIPACAGNSPASPNTPTSYAVHPRVCGELLRPTALASAHAGSSPRVRGTREVAVRGERHRRFIPACAGNS